MSSENGPLTRPKNVRIKAAMTHAQFIEALGNGTQIAAWLEAATGKRVGREAVYKWRANDIPLKWRPHLVRMATEKGVALPENFMAWVDA